MPAARLLALLLFLAPSAPRAAEFPGVTVVAGSFGVDDNDSFNHFYVNPPSGVDWDSALKEVAVRTQAAVFSPKEKLFLRNLVFRHHAAYFADGYQHFPVL